MTDLDPDYAVLRAPSILGFELEGMWFDLNDMPPKPPEGDLAASFISPSGTVYIALPTNQFEVRSDGAFAEVWQVTLDV